MQESLAGRGGLLKEYSLGAEVFERGDQFDPRMDPIVRVQARNLRARLALYYDGPGIDDPMVIELPKRTYHPVFRARAANTEPVVLAAEAAIVPASGIVSIPDAVPVSNGVRPETAPAVTVTATATANGTRRNPTFVAAALLILFAGAATFWQVNPQAARHRDHETDTKAQDLYTRGRYLMDRQTEAALRESIECFEQAAARDPKFAAAYAGMADAYNVLAQYGLMAPSDGMRRARQAADRAIQIDPGLAEGHVSLAAVIEAYDWDWKGAEREYRKALSLNPELPTAHLWFGMFLRDQGRLAEAMPELRRAAQLEPFSVMTNLNLAHGLMAEGDYQAAAEAARHATELAPDLASGQLTLASVYRAQAQNADAEAALARAAECAGDNPHILAALGKVYARVGKREESTRMLKQLEDLRLQRYVSPFDMGTLHLALGDEESALTELNEAYRQRSSGLIFLREWKFDSSSRSQEFKSLISKMHFKG